MIQIVGDGLAGLMLAAELEDCEVWGDDCCNTPPQALVHLFAGRTFRREPLQVDIFEASADYWRQEPLARETTVRRFFSEGDRLDRSLSACQVPERYLPHRVGTCEVTYGPGFSVAARALRQRLLSEIRYRPGRVDLSQGGEGVRVLATGVDTPGSVDTVAWDMSDGQCLQATASSPTPEIWIGRGVHIGPELEGTGVVIGGSPDLKTASHLTGKNYQSGQSWYGRRCANAVDRWPMLGWLDSKTFLFVSFGSRGLFWLPYCVKVAARALKLGTDEPIPLALRHSRFS